MTSDVHAPLANEGWPEPYDYHSIEGLPRLLRQLEGVEAGLQHNSTIARLFVEVGERWGQAVYGKALPWITSRREGSAFHDVRLYPLSDLRDALVEIGTEAAELRELFDGELQ